MSNFKNFNDQIKNQFNKMQKTGKLFRVNVSGDMIWETYISSFENNIIFRDPNSSFHNCNCCKNFIRRYGNIVSINSDGVLESIFSNLGYIGEYTNPANFCNILITNAEIENVFFETFDELNIKVNYESCKKTQSEFQLGIEQNFKRYTEIEANLYPKTVEVGKVYTFDHFGVKLSKDFVDFTGKSHEAIMAFYRDKYSVFKRMFKEISLDTLILVKDLINQGSLLDGTSHLYAIDIIIQLYKEKQKSNLNLENWCWFVTYKMDERIAKFKNTLIGVLCTELAEGMDLNKACENWNKRVDPINYMKASAPITKKQIEEAKRFVEENGYEASFDRRLATIDDIKVSEIKHINVGNGEIQKVSIFDNVKSTSTRHKRSEFDKIEEVSIDKFMKDILPNCTSIEAFLENRMEGNLVTMTTSNQKDSKPIFKWNNNYSWSFNGNLAGKSQIKNIVQSKGGNISGVLMCRLIWNDENQSDHSDLDLWCSQPNLQKIGFSQGFRKDSGNIFSSCKGQLDLDDRGGKQEIHAENIYFIDSKSLMNGNYKFRVNQYRARNSKGFKVEIEFDGEIYSYSYNKPLKQSENIDIASVNFSNGKFSITHHLPETNSSKEFWNLETNNFHKVNLVCLSPNHWDNNKVGNLHYFFMLDKCKTNTLVRGFHNENLISDLLQHRKVMEVLGTQSMIEPTDKQLSGIGFNSTVRDELIIKCSGSFKRMLKIKF